jgi:ABC-type sulfate transport system substrate-binding protein
MTWDKHFPSDRELDDIKQLLDTRTIHIQLGANPDVESSQSIAVVEAVEKRMREIFGEHAVKQARSALAALTAQEIYDGADGTRAFHSMYDTALMRIWWEKFGDTVDVRRSVGNGAVGGRLGSADGADADEAAQPLQEGTSGEAPSH